MNSLSRYYNVRDSIQPADIIFFSDSPDLISRLISWKTKSKYTHCAIVMSKMSSAGERLVIIEAVEHGLRPVYLSKRIQEYNGHIWHFPIKEATLEQRIKANDWVWDRTLEATKYDYHSLLKLAVSKVSTDYRKLICSETCQIALEHSKIIEKRSRILSPAELALLVIYNPINQLL